MSKGADAATGGRTEVATVQMFGVGILELMVILVLAMLVVGPDRLPQVAGDLARWIRRTRAYAQHLMKDFNEVMGDLEKEMGASREDWQEIASVVSRHTGEVTREISRVAGQLERAGEPETAAEPSNVVAFESGRPLGETPPAESGPAPEPQDGEVPLTPAEDKPWYVPERPTRLRHNE